MSERGIGPEILESCRQGDREALRVLFEAYKDRVYSICFYFFDGDRAAAQDATQQVFLKLMTAMGQFRGESEFSTWLYRMVVNACIDRRRSGLRLLFIGDFARFPWFDRKRSQEDDYHRRQLADEVKLAVGKLSPKLRLPVLLRYFEELSYEEMARALNCSVGTVSSRLNRAHKALAQRLAHLRGAATGEA